MASTVTSTGLQATRQASWAATLAIVGSAYFALAVAALHFLKPDLDPVSRMTSEYANGPYSFVMSSAFLAMGVGCLALVAALYREVPRRALSLAGLVFFGLWAVGVLVAMTFPIDPGGVPVTLAGTIHQTAGPATFLCAAVGVSLLSWRFGRDEQLRSIQPALLALSAVVVVGFVVTASFFFTGTELAGLAQRVVLATVVVWIVLVASKLRPAALR
jgi:hypothetical protein